MSILRGKKSRSHTHFQAVFLQCVSQEAVSLFSPPLSQKRSGQEASHQPGHYNKPTSPMSAALVTEQPQNVTVESVLLAEMLPWQVWKKVLCKDIRQMMACCYSVKKCPWYIYQLQWAKTQQHNLLTPSQHFNHMYDVGTDLQRTQHHSLLQWRVHPSGLQSTQPERPESPLPASRTLPPSPHFHIETHVTLNIHCLLLKLRQDDNCGSIYLICTEVGLSSLTDVTWMFLLHLPPSALLSEHWHTKPEVRN